MCILILRVSIVGIRELRLSCIGGKIRNRLKKCLRSWGNRAIIWSMRPELPLRNRPVSAFQNVWKILRRKKCWGKIMSGFAPNVKILCWPRNKWKYSRFQKYLSSAWKGSNANSISPKKLARMLSSIQICGLPSQRPRHESFRLQSIDSQRLLQGRRSEDGDLVGWTLLWSDRYQQPFRKHRRRPLHSLLQVRMYLTQGPDQRLMVRFWRLERVQVEK